MEGETQRATRKTPKKRRRKRGSPQPPAPPHHPRDAFFPLAVASYANMGRPSVSHILKQLLRTHLAFLRGRGGGGGPHFLDQILPPGLLSLLPLLLNQTHKVGVTVLAAEMVGAIALCSLDANGVIASDGETVRAVVAALGSPSKKVAAAACNAVLDLVAAPLGRERLRESLAVEKLLLLLCLLH